MFLLLVGGRSQRPYRAPVEAPASTPGSPMEPPTPAGPFSPGCREHPIVPSNCPWRSLSLDTTRTVVAHRLRTLPVRGDPRRMRGKRTLAPFPGVNRVGASRPLSQSMNGATASCARVRCDRLPTLADSASPTRDGRRLQSAVRLGNGVSERSRPRGGAVSRLSSRTRASPNAGSESTSSPHSGRPGSGNIGPKRRR